MNKKKKTSAVGGRVLNYTTDVKPVRTTDFISGDFIPFGSDNLFPEACALLSRSSSNHRGVINSKMNYLPGNGMISEDKKLQYLFEKVNFEGQTIIEVVDQLMLDDEFTGNMYIEIIKDRSNSFLWFNHIDSTKCRLSKDGENVIIHPNWANYISSESKKVVLPLYPKFISEKNEYGRFVDRSVLHVKRYEPEFTYYGLPLWFAGRDNVEIDFKTNRWNLSRLKNSFRLSGILIVPVKDPDEGNEVLNYLEKQHLQEGQNNKLLTITKSRALEGEKADVTQLIETKQDDDGSWMKLIEMSLTQTIVAHSWFRSLMSIPDNTGFDTNRVLQEYKIALNTIISKRQQFVLDKIFKRVFLEQQGIKDLDLKFINTPPLVDDTYKYVWEVREERGLEVDKNDPAQMVIIMDNTIRSGKTDTNKSSN